MLCPAMIQQPVPLEHKKACENKHSPKFILPKHLWASHVCQEYGCSFNPQTFAMQTTYANYLCTIPAPAPPTQVVARSSNPSPDQKAPLQRGEFNPQSSHEYRANVTASNNTRPRHTDMLQTLRHDRHEILDDDVGVAKSPSSGIATASEAKTSERPPLAMPPPPFIASRPFTTHDPVITQTSQATPNVQQRRPNSHLIEHKTSQPHWAAPVTLSDGPLQVVNESPDKDIPMSTVETDSITHYTAAVPSTGVPSASNTWMDSVYASQPLGAPVIGTLGRRAQAYAAQPVLRSAPAQKRHRGRTAGSKNHNRADGIKAPKVINHHTR